MNTQSKNHIDDDLLQQRQQPPKVPELSARIIAAAEDAPQNVAPAAKEPHKHSFLKRFFADGFVPRFAVPAGLVVLMAIVIMSPDTNQEISPQNLPVASDAVVTNDMEFINEEFDWDELLLLQDELLFAQL